MSLPSLLVIDDQYARDTTEWGLFLHRTGLAEADVGTTNKRTAGKVKTLIAEVVLCSGQRVEPGRVENDYEVIRAAVCSGGGRGEDWALIFLDVSFDSGELRDAGSPRGQHGDGDFGERMLSRLAKDFPDLPVVMLTSKRQEELGDHGTPYLWKQGLNRHTVQAALLRHGRLDSTQVRALLELGDEVVAEAPGTVAVVREAFLNSGSKLPILILGESGTGKEILARYVHRLSGRTGSFVAVNCGAIPAELLESDFFGHEKGAFTGAVGLRKGRFEQADGGTLFLDEIGEMPLAMQVKILRVLQEGTFERVGGTQTITVDVRIVCATNRNLEEARVKGEFREDLFYRINNITITLPPLRDRRQDIGPLARLFLAKAAEIGGKTGISLTPEAVLTLEGYYFPGNVRELENLMGRLANGAGSHEVIGRDAVTRLLASAVPIDPAAPPPLQPAATGETISLTGLAEALAQTRIDSNAPALNGIKAKLDAAHRELLQRLAGAALERCRDPVTGVLNRQRAMQLLSGDPTLTGRGPARVLNEILGRKQENRITEEDLESLVRLWKGKNT